MEREKHILLVEDEKLSGLAVQETLEGAGYRVTLLAMGESAIKAVRDATIAVPDLILLDIDLGDGIDGTETARRILAERSLPIVFLSAHTEAEVLARIEEITSYGHIVKNTGDTVLLASIRMAFQLWDAHQALRDANKEKADNLRLQNDLFEQVPGAIYQYQYYPDGSSRFPMASPNIELVYEVTPGEVAEDATRVFERVHPDDLDGVMNAIRESRDTLQDWEQDYRVVLPQRGERWLRGRAKPEKLSDGSVLWHGYITDITQEKEMERTRAEDRTRLVSILESADVGTWEWNVQTGETRFNQRWAEIIGYTLDELAPVSIETWQNFAHPDDIERSNRALEAHFSGETEFYDCETRMRHKDGHWVWVRDHGKVTTWTSDGQPKQMFGTHQDISDIVEFQDRLRQSEEKYATMTTHSPMIIALKDLETDRLVDVNEAFCRLLGYDRAEVLGVGVTDLIGIKPQVYDLIAEAFDRDGAFHSVETQFLTKEGTPVDVLLYGARVELEDRELGLLNAIDIRPRKAAESKLKQALAVKETLMAELNHRVKNNLAMVASLISLKNNDLGDSVDLSDLESRVRAIASLHQQLQESAELDRVSLKPYIRRVVNNAFDSAYGTVDIDLQIEEREIPTKHATTLGLIINELATNAMKHGFIGVETPKFTVVHAVEGRECRLQVTNNGRPFPEEVVPEASPSMGLRLVYSLVDQLDGAIDLDRSPETRFTIRYSRPWSEDEE